MNNALVSVSGSAIPPEVQAFAGEKGVSRYLNAVIDLARQAFPTSALCVSLEQDAEDDRHRYIALEVEVPTCPEVFYANYRTTSQPRGNRPTGKGGL